VRTGRPAVRPPVRVYLQSTEGTQTGWKDPLRGGPFRVVVDLWSGFHARIIPGLCRWGKGKMEAGQYDETTPQGPAGPGPHRAAGRPAICNETLLRTDRDRLPRTGPAARPAILPDLQFRWEPASARHGRGGRLHFTNETLAGRGEARLGLAWLGLARQGKAGIFLWRRAAKIARRGMARHGEVWLGKAGPGKAGLCMARQGFFGGGWAAKFAWLGGACQGGAWLGKARHGRARLGKARCFLVLTEQGQFF